MILFNEQKYPTIHPSECTAQEIEAAKKAGWAVTRNLMTNQEIWIRADSVGGCTDPQTERYWSM